MVFSERTSQLSKFNIVSAFNDKYLVFNTLTRGMMLLDEEYYDMLANHKNLPENVFSTFMNYGFLIEKSYDEISELKFRNRRARFDASRMYITVMATNACNFRCKYCYQMHKTAKMSREGKELLLSFIHKKIESGVNDIKIHWFGGEPLLNFTFIQSVEKKMKQLIASRNIHYSSSITTNGFLLDDVMIKKIRDTNIHYLQITIDGIESVHNKTRVLADGSGSFKKILSNIKLCIGAKIPVIIRYNINRLNENIEPFLDYLQSEGIAKDVQLHFNEAKKYDICYTDENIFYSSTHEYSHVLLKVYEKLLSRKFLIPKYPLTNIACEFDCINNFLIDMDGRMYQCSACEPEDEFYLGSINNTPHSMTKCKKRGA